MVMAISNSDQAGSLVGDLLNYIFLAEPLKILGAIALILFLILFLIKVWKVFDIFHEWMWVKMHDYPSRAPEEFSRTPNVNLDDSIFKFTERLYSAICNSGSNKTLVLDASWGYGKTTVLKQLVNFHKEKVDYVVFNPWIQTTVDSYLAKIFLSIVLQSGHFSESLSLREYFVMKKYFNQLNRRESKLTKVSPILSVFDNSFDIEKDNFHLYTDMIKLLRSVYPRMGKKLCLIMDDVDRLSSEEVLALYKIADSLSILPGVVLLFSMDKSIVANNIKDETSGKPFLYMEKIMDRTFDFPLHYSESLSKQFNQKLQLVLSKHDLLFSNVSYTRLSSEEMERLIVMIGKSTEDVSKVFEYNHVVNYRTIEHIANYIDDKLSIYKNSIEIGDIIRMAVIKNISPEIYKNLSKKHLQNEITFSDLGSSSDEIKVLFCYDNCYNNSLLSSCKCNGNKEGASISEKKQTFVKTIDLFNTLESQDIAPVVEEIVSNIFTNKGKAHTNRLCYGPYIYQYYHVVKFNNLDEEQLLELSKLLASNELFELMEIINNGQEIERELALQKLSAHLRKNDNYRNYFKNNNSEEAYDIVCNFIDLNTKITPSLSALLSMLRDITLFCSDIKDYTEKTYQEFEKEILSRLNSFDKKLYFLELVYFGELHGKKRLSVVLENYFASSIEKSLSDLEIKALIEEHDSTTLKDLFFFLFRAREIAEEDPFEFEALYKSLVVNTEFCNMMEKNLLDSERQEWGNLFKSEQ